MLQMENRVLDGNAAAGLLGQIFVPEITAAVVCCAHCETVGPLGAGLLYHGAGSVLRCRACQGVLLRVVTAPDRMFLEMTGIRSLEFANA